jgi:diketogulonate reductase-like aldo/keto reductase
MIASSTTVALGAGREPWPRLGLGTWRLGESARAAEPEGALIRHALDIGYRLFDTAEMYGEGGAESVLGQALAQALRGRSLRREQLFVVSKAYPHHGDAAGLRRACDASRRRLQLETIDLYLLHWRGGIPLTDTVRGLEQLQQRGWIRQWGVSNFDVADLDELRAVPGGSACVANQVYYSLSERGVEFELLPLMRHWPMALMAYCPIDGGRIARHARLSKLAASLSLSAVQLALAWLLSQRGVLAIPKAGSEAHLAENWRSRDVVLSGDVLSALDAMFPKPVRKQALAMR